MRAASWQRPWRASTNPELSQRAEHCCGRAPESCGDAGRSELLFHVELSQLVRIDRSEGVAHTQLSSRLERVRTPRQRPPFQTRIDSKTSGKALKSCDINRIDAESPFTHSRGGRR